VKFRLTNGRTKVGKKGVGGGGASRQSGRDGATEPQREVISSSHGRKDTRVLKVEGTLGGVLMRRGGAGIISSRGELSKGPMLGIETKKKKK